MATFVHDPDGVAEEPPDDEMDDDDANPALDARYGRSRQSAVRSRWIAWIGAALVAVVFAAWLVWVGIDSASTVDVRDTGYTIHNEHTVSVSFEVTLPPGDAATCAVQTLNESFAIVGWKIVQIPASEQRTRAFTEVVRTSEESTTGLIYGCSPA